MEWTNVDIIRPEVATWVLGLCSKGSYWLCFRANGGWYITTKYGQYYCANDDKKKEIEIAYWLPIPELPKELFSKLFPDKRTDCYLFKHNCCECSNPDKCLKNEENKTHPRRQA